MLVILVWCEFIGTLDRGNFLGEVLVDVVICAATIFLQDISVVVEKPLAFGVHLIIKCLDLEVLCIDVFSGQVSSYAGDLVFEIGQIASVA